MDHSLTQHGTKIANKRRIVFSLLRSTEIQLACHGFHLYIPIRSLYHNGNKKITFRLFNFICGWFCWGCATICPHMATQQSLLRVLKLIRLLFDQLGTDLRPINAAFLYAYTDRGRWWAGKLLTVYPIQKSNRSTDSDGTIRMKNQKVWGFQNGVSGQVFVPGSKSERDQLSTYILRNAEELWKEFLAKCSVGSSSLSTQFQPLIQNEQIIGEILESESLSQGSVYYDIFFYQPNNAPFMIKLHVSDVLPLWFVWTPPKR